MGLWPTGQYLCAKCGAVSGAVGKQSVCAAPREVRRDTISKAEFDATQGEPVKISCGAHKFCTLHRLF
jgi:hypothetical protein